jgi:hypothetical protein
MRKLLPVISQIKAFGVLQVEHVIREQNIMAANEIVELFCELVVTRLPIIAKQKYVFLQHFFAFRITSPENQVLNLCHWPTFSVGNVHQT